MNYFSSHNTIVTVPQPVAMPAVGQALEIAFEAFGPLYKHCKNLHLPSAGRTLRVGTLSEYRRNENSAVRDQDEGTFSLTLQFPVVTQVKTDMLKMATLGTSPLGEGFHDNNLRTSYFVGQYTTGSIFSTDDVVIEQQTDKAIFLSGKINIHAEGADAYVLCFSRTKNPGSVILDPEYDSVWGIRAGSVFNLAQEVQTILCRSFIPDDCFLSETVGPLNAPGFSPPPRHDELIFTVSAEIWKVEYRDRNIVIETDITDEIVREVHQCLDRSAFIKPSVFGSEEEIRIIFRPLFFDKRSGSRYLFPNHLRPVFVPFDSLLSYIAPVAEL